MLCITRKLNERIYIGNDIEIMITRCHLGKVGLSIKAPLHVTIMRAELVDGKEDKNEAPKHE